MIEADPDKQANINRDGKKEASLPLRDWILLPFLSLLTLCLLLIPSEWIADRTYYTTGNVGRYCMFDDPSIGYRGIPNSVCTEKNPETPLIEYRFNSCGDRAGMECGPKPNGVYRIVMAGTSTPMGYGVSRNQSFAALLPAQLSALAGRRIEIYNQGLVKSSPRSLSLAFNQPPPSRPDLLLWVLTPNDIKGEPASAPVQIVGNAAGSDASRPGRPLSFAERVRNRLKEVLATGSISDPLLEIWHDHPISEMTEHFLYESQSLYLKFFLKGPAADFLKIEPDAEWTGGLKQFSSMAEGVETRARTAGIPFAAVLTPGRAQAAMISMGEWPAGYNPYKLDNELRSIIVSHGGTYIDIVPDFRTIPNPEQLYYPIDGHFNARGNAVIAGLLAKELTSGAIPPLKAAAQPQVKLAKGN